MDQQRKLRAEGLIVEGYRALADWESRWPEFETDESLDIAPEKAHEIIRELTDRLQDNYPFFHPHYAGQMIKPAHPIAAAAYAIAQRINPNNHALDGGPATAAMEREVIADLAGMFGYDPETTLGHLTSSGTIANLEALWVSRSLHPDRTIAYSSEAHYTHSRMCEVLRVEGVGIECDRTGRMDLDALQTVLRTRRVGTVVATTGTTSLGAVDPVHEIIPMARAHDARVHVDGAHGGFFALLALTPEKAHCRAPLQLEAGRGERVLDFPTPRPRRGCIARYRRVR